MDRPACPAAPGGGRSRDQAITSGERRVVLLTSDGIAIEAEHRPAADASGRLAIVLAHGFTGALDRPAVRRVAGQLGRYGGVITFSFRGHGRSGGRSTVGDLEVRDLDAAVRWARRLGYARVAAVGFSMGASVVLRHAGACGRAAAAAGGGGGTGLGGGGTASAGGGTAAGPGGDTGLGGAIAAGPGGGTGLGGAMAAGPGGDGGTGARAGVGTAPGAGRGGGPGGGPRAGEAMAPLDAVVAISSPARWYYRGTAPMRRLHWVVMNPAGRLISRFGLRTRIHPEDWDPVPPSPVEAVPFIPPVPLLIVHGDRDAYFPVDHPLSLAAAAGPGGADLWLEHGFGHAENAADPALLARVGGWLTSRVLPPGGEPS